MARTLPPSMCHQHTVSSLLSTVTCARGEEKVQSEFREK